MSVITKEEKEQSVNNWINRLIAADTYTLSIAYAGYAQGMASAWYFDGTMGHAWFEEVNKRTNEILDNKRILV